MISLSYTGRATNAVGVKMWRDKKKCIFDKFRTVISPFSSTYTHVAWAKQKKKKTKKEKRKRKKLVVNAARMRMRKYV
jgi:hypothetical protein